MNYNRTSVVENSTQWNNVILQLTSFVKGEELEVESGIAGPLKKHMWESYFQGNVMPLMKESRQKSDEFFGMQIVFNFLEILKNEFNRMPKKLAVHHSGNKIYVWAEVLDNDTETTDAILYSVIDANYLNKENGISISTMIVEESENISVPSQYSIIA